MRLAPFAGVIALLAAPQGPLAGDPGTRLEYTRDKDIRGCPDADWIEREVARSLGYAPFSPGAETALSIAITSDDDGRLRAVIERVDASGARRGRRELTGAGDCRDLSRAVVLALVLTLDPFADPAQGHADERADAPDMETERGAGAPEMRGAEPHEPKWRFGAGVFGAAAAAPALTPGASVRASIHRGRYSLTLEVRATLPASTAFEDGRVESSLAFASLVPCVRIGPVAGCLLASGGLLRGRGVNFQNTRSIDRPYAAAGGRVAWRVPMLSGVGLELSADLSLALARTSLTVSGAKAWRLPPVSATLGLAADVALP